MAKKPYGKTAEYERLRSQKRRAAAAADGKCNRCKTNPVTRGTYGKNHRTYRTCKPCRAQARDHMAKRRRSVKAYQDKSTSTPSLPGAQ